MASYIYDQQWEQERTRVAGLAAIFDATTIRHLSTAGVADGWHCWEVGAGTGSIASWLASAVGTQGRVLATDLDTTFLRDLDEPPVEVERHDVTVDPVEEGAFDLVHARALLMHVTDPAAVVARLARALRPGGVLVVEDAVFGGPSTRLWEPFTSPPAASGALSNVMDAVAAGFRGVGADPDCGFALAPAVRAAGLGHVEAEVTHRLLHGGSPEAAFYELSLRQLGDRLIEAGLLTRADADVVAATAADPGADWLSVGLVSVTGRIT
ncbi:class I SAM-dependent methyltransferase [Cryptosporangium phraense]|uniref:Methyltransferase domain-containing protein n=1 Tax=Cryptosporangium phraense TaxID=2593070 RepID=A0A545AV42_9ACTN|nr:class I SAM-dependent methyltransferase [Cryptosporangium phraense]TQS45196.1 methyltransferase domain-containing protein [Cryptosporangium phraense]